MYHVWQYVVFNLLKSFFFEYFYRTIFLWRKKVKKDLEKNKESAVIDTRYIRFSSFHSLFHMSSIIMFVLPITSDTDVPPCHVAKLYIIISFGLPLPILPLFWYSGFFHLIMYPQNVDRHFLMRVTHSLCDLASFISAASTSVIINSLIVLRIFFPASFDKDICVFFSLKITFLHLSSVIKHFFFEFLVVVYGFLFC